MTVYPHSLAYFNELAGGPIGGRDHLGHSNLDLGQDLLYLQRWLVQHPDVQRLRLDYYPAHLVDPHLAGITFLDARRGITASTRYDGLPRGWYAISVAELQRHSSPWQCLKGIQPAATVGYTIWIYCIEPQPAARPETCNLVPRPSTLHTAP